MNSFAIEVYNIVISALTLLIFLRFIFQLAGVSYLNPVVASTYKVTKIVDIFGRILPTIGNGRLNLAALVLIVLIHLLNLTVQSMLIQGNGLAPDQLVLSALFGLILSFLKFCRYLIFGSIIVSWILVLTQSPSPIISLIMQMAEPLLAPIRRIMPDTGPIDLSPIVAFLLISICERVLVHAGNSLQLVF